MNAPVTKPAPLDAGQSTAADAKPRRPLRRLLLRVGPVVLLIAAALGGTWYWQTGRFLVETDAVGKLIRRTLELAGK